MTKSGRPAGRIDDPDFYAEVKRRYEAGERDSLMGDLNIPSTTLYKWAQRYGWKDATYLEKHASIVELLLDGATISEVVEELGVSKTTVARIRLRLIAQGEHLPAAPRGPRRDADKYDRIIARLRRGVPMSEIVASMDVSFPTVIRFRRQLIEQGEQLPEPPPLGIQRNTDKYERILTGLRNGATVRDIVDRIDVS